MDEQKAVEVHDDIIKLAASNVNNISPITTSSSIVQTDKSKVNSSRRQCDLCEPTFGSQPNLLRHKIIVNYTRRCKNTCKECVTEDFEQNQVSTTISRRNTNELNQKTMALYNLQRLYMYQHMLGKHMRVVHVESLGRYRCGECQLEFYNRAQLREQIGVVHRNVKYICKTCGKSFSFLYSLSRHMTSCMKQKINSISRVNLLRKCGSLTAFFDVFLSSRMHTVSV